MVDTLSRFEELREALRSKSPKAAATLFTGRQVLERPKPTADGLPDLMPGRFIQREVGRHFLKETLTPSDAQHGRCEVAHLSKQTPFDLAILGLDDPFLEAEKPVVYLDTETTGLSGGTGTYAFLVGLGYWQGDGFLVEQYFMTDYEEEPALLEALAERVSSFSAVVTYNGRSFDMPLLRSRFRMYRYESAVDNLPHLDFLTASRRIWGRILESCSLSSVERDILGVRRSGDVPGALIPRIYFEYLKHKDPTDLKAVFYHNAQDILSLAMLTWKASRMLADPFSENMTPSELFSVGRWKERVEDFSQAIACYEHVRSHHPGTKASRLARNHLAVIHKKNQNWPAALSFWQEAFRDPKGAAPLGLYRDCAIYFEHVAREYSKAIEIVREALDRLELESQFAKDGSENPTAIREDFQYRLARLMRKNL